MGGTALLLFAAGCSSVVNSHRQKESIVKAWEAGNAPLALKEVDEKLKWSDSGDRVMWLLEAGGLHFQLGNYDESLRHFTEAERLIADYDHRALVSLRDAGSEGAAALTNPNLLAYRGFCRDRVMLPVYKALAYLGKGNREAFRTEVFRLREVQDQVLNDFRKSIEAEEKALAEAKSQYGVTNANTVAKGNDDFRNSNREVQAVARRGYGNFLNPFAIWLSALTYLRDGDLENAHVDFERLYRAMPGNPLARRGYRTILDRTGREVPATLAKTPAFEFPLERDSVYLVFANGRSAAFRQIAVYFPVMTAWPVCEYYPAPYQRFECTAGGKTYQTGTVADMDGILSQEYEERLTAMIIRITISTLIKEGGSYTAAYFASREDTTAGILVLLASIAYRATFNTADTRSWEMLPKEFQVVQLPMPADRKLTLSPDGAAAGRRDVQLPAGCDSAMVFIHAPGRQGWEHRVFPM